MAASSVLNRLVNSLGGTLGFFHSDTKGEIKQCVSEAMSAGMTEDQACDFVGRVWRVAASEYGE